MGPARGGFNNDFDLCRAEHPGARAARAVEVCGHRPFGCPRPPRKDLMADIRGGGAPKFPSLSAGATHRRLPFELQPVASSEPEAVARRPSKERAIALY